MEPLQSHGEVGHRGIHGEKVHGGYRSHGLAEYQKPQTQILRRDAPGPTPQEAEGPEGLRRPDRAQNDRQAADDQKGHRHLQEMEQVAGLLSSQGQIESRQGPKGEYSYCQAVHQHTEKQRCQGQPDFRHRIHPPQSGQIGAAIRPHAMRPPLASWRSYGPE